MAEGRRILMETGGNHVASVRRGRGHNCTSRQQRRGINGCVLAGRAVVERELLRGNGGGLLIGER